ncbi:hypothetical protein [Nocardia sp. bgisy134]|uniref:hypothetical protein n=1 Tax=Nocardia sp. bgisy134 TaxID=3413789 RepID=UPI003D74E421
MVGSILHPIHTGRQTKLESDSLNIVENLNRRPVRDIPGSRGIGLATARRLTAEGVRAVGGARQPTAEPEATGATAVAVDLATPGGADEPVARATAGGWHVHRFSRFHCVTTFSASSMQAGQHNARG